jgi:hypothetical protein
MKIDNEKTAIVCPFCGRIYNSEESFSKHLDEDCYKGLDKK